YFFFQAEDGIRDFHVTGVQTCALPICRLVTCGSTSGWEAETDIRYVFAKQLTILGSYMGSKGELLELLPWVAAGRLRPVVHTVFPLSEAAQAHRLLEAQGQFGKVVLEPPAG